MAEKKRILLKDFKPNNYYDSPIWLDEKFLLLAPDTPVSESLLKDLKTWGFDCVWTEGSSLGKISMAGGVGTETKTSAVLNNDAKEQEGRREAKKFFEKFSSFTGKIYGDFSRDGYLDMNAVTERVKEAIDMVKERRSFILRLSDLYVEGMNYIFTHSARTTILALTIGEAMKIPHHKLIELGIAGLLHEVGMMKIPRQVYDKNTSLNENEKKLIHTHCFQGWDMLRSFSKKNSLALPQDILLGVWQHHERANGSGYPQGLQGDGISLFGKILGVSCSYNAQISPQTYQESRDGHSSLVFMLKEMQELYDEKVIRALLFSLSLYPIGSYVRLKNGSIGVVVDTGNKNPKFPVVKLLLNEGLHFYKEQPLVKTQNDDDLSVVGVLSSQEIAELTERKLLID